MIKYILFITAYLALIIILGWSHAHADVVGKIFRATEGFYGDGSNLTNLPAMRQDMQNMVSVNMNADLKFMDGSGTAWNITAQGIDSVYLRSAATTGTDPAGLVGLTGGNSVNGDAGLVYLVPGQASGSGTQGRVAIQGHVGYSGNLVTAGSCGTSPSFARAGDLDGIVTVGTGGVATSCAMTFAYLYGTGKNPSCVANSDTDIVALKVVTTATTLTISATAPFTASSHLHYHCMAAN